MKDLSTKQLGTLRRQARILILLDVAARAGLTPMPIVPFHAFAYLSNVLAAVWDMPALDGKILKRKGGPFYPELQRDLDRLVGMGMVLVTEVTHILDSSGKDTSVNNCLMCWDGNGFLSAPECSSSRRGTAPA